MKSLGSQEHLFELFLFRDERSIELVSLRTIWVVKTDLNMFQTARASFTGPAFPSFSSSSLTGLAFPSIPSLIPCRKAADESVRGAPGAPEPGVAARQKVWILSFQTKPIRPVRFFIRPLQDGQKPTVAFLGDEGRISLVSLASRQLTGTLRMAGSSRAAAFSPDGSQLLSLGEVLEKATGRCTDTEAEKATGRCTDTEAEKATGRCTDINSPVLGVPRVCLVSGGL